MMVMLNQLPPDGDKKVTKPIDKEIAEESSKPATGVALNQYGLPINRGLKSIFNKQILIVQEQKLKQKI
jgi:hypothetical protein